MKKIAWLILLTLIVCNLSAKVVIDKNDVTSANIAGSLPNTVVTNNYNGTVTATSFTGDGSGLTGISVSHPTESYQYIMPGQVFGVATENMMRDYVNANGGFRVPAGSNKTIVELAARLLSDDSGANDPNFGLIINGVRACTLNMVVGSVTGWISTIVTHDNVVTAGSTIEMWTGAEGSNNDASDLNSIMYMKEN